jgi:type I restriction enzyme, R subunit
MSDYKTIAETKNFIVLDKYTRAWQASEAYQTEYDLEREFIQDLKNQGYEYIPDLNTSEKMLANVRVQLQDLNKVHIFRSRMDEIL